MTERSQMSKIESVRLLEETSSMKMENTINHLLKKGYQLLSAVTKDNNYYMATLVMYKPEEKVVETPKVVDNLSYIKE